MSICHKADLFDSDAFMRELHRILYEALRTDYGRPLREFIDTHRESMTHFWDWQPLLADWHVFPDEPNRIFGVQALADIALSRYYQRDGGFGLDYGFDALGRYFRSVPKLRRIEGALICGYLVGPPGRRLDLGRQGTGIVSARQAREHLEKLEGVTWPEVPGPKSRVWKDVGYKPSSPQDVIDSREQLLRLYRAAVRENLGILFQDFNDMGSERM